MIDWAQIFQINASDGGVPKRSLQQAEVTEQGLVGDRQRDRKHHGGPTRALCLYSLELIKALQGEGHPVFPGSIGENITVAGLDWHLIVPGVRLALGDEVVVEITSYTTPCRTIQRYFIDHRFGRVSQASNPGWSRVYAAVVVPGLIRTGDRITQLG